MPSYGRYGKTVDRLEKLQKICTFITIIGFALLVFLYFFGIDIGLTSYELIGVWFGVVIIPNIVRVYARRKAERIKMGQ